MKIMPITESDRCRVSIRNSVTVDNEFCISITVFEKEEDFIFFRAPVDGDHIF